MRGFAYPIVVISLVISILSLSFLPKLSLDLIPQPKDTRLSISYTLPNASPQIIEESITSLLENQFSTLSQLEKITSESSYQKGNIILEFHKSTDLNLRKLQILNILRQIKKQLPEDASYPEVNALSPENQEEEQALITISLRGDQPIHELKHIAEKNLRTPLSSLLGLKELRISGPEEIQYTFTYHPPQLQTLNLTPQYLQEFLRSYGEQAPLGMVFDNEHHLLSIKTSQNELDIDNLLSQNIQTNAGILPLGSLLSVSKQHQLPPSLFRLNGKNALTLSLFPLKNINRIDLAASIRTKIKSLQQQLPQTISLHIESDQSEYLEEELTKIYKRSGLSLAILLLFLILSRRSLKDTLLLLYCLFVNVSICVLGAYLLDLQIHLYTLAGWAVSFGMVVDNGIVMLDHLRKTGKRSVFLAMFAATLTTLSALSLIFFLDEKTRASLIDFAIMVILNLGVSLFVALWLSPALFYLFPYKKTTGFRRLPKWNQLLLNLWMGALQKLRHYPKTLSLCLLLFFGTPFFMLPEKIGEDSWYTYVFDHPYFKKKIRPELDFWLGGWLRPFVLQVYNKDFYRSPERKELIVSAELPIGTTLEQMDAAIRPLEYFLQENTGIERFETTVRAQFAYIRIVFLKELEQSAYPYQLKARLISKALDWDGVRWYISPIGSDEAFTNGRGGSLSSMRMEIRGYQKQEVEKWVEIAAQKLLAHKRIQEVTRNARHSPFERYGKEYIFTFSNDQLLNYQIHPIHLQQEIIGLSPDMSPFAYKFIEGSSYPFYLKATEANDFNIHRLLTQSHLSPSAPSWALGALGKLRQEKVATSIRRENRSYIQMLEYDYFGTQLFADRYQDKIIEELKTLMPPGYDAKSAKFTFDWSKQKRSYLLLGLVALMMYLICAILFENFFLPLLICLVLPFSVLGVFIAFAGFGFSFDQGGYASFVLLGGISINASILLVHAWAFETKGKNALRRIRKALIMKLEPISLTTFSTCLGMLPFMLDGQNEVFWFALSAGTIGGLILSWFSVFFILPLFFLPNKTQKVL